MNLREFNYEMKHRVKLGVGLKEYERGKAYISKHYHLTPLTYEAVIKELAKRTGV